MPVPLHDKCKLSLLSHCAVNLSGNGRLPRVGVEEDNQISLTRGNKCTQSCQYMLGGQWSCGCRKLDGLLDHCWMVSAGKFNCIQRVDGSRIYIARKIKWIPKFHHIHWNGVEVSLSDLHVILYKSPTFGGHHFSLGVSSSEQVKTPLKKPKWLEELHQKQLLLDLDTVVMAVNSATGASLLFGRCVGVGPERSTIRFLFAWSQSCVDYAEKAALHRHSMWSSVAIDVLLGNILGVA